MTPAPSTPRLTLRLGRFCYLALNVAVVIFLLAPIAIVFVFALNPTPYIQFPPVGVSLRWFEKFFASRDFMNALWLSLEVAAMTTIAATLFGASAALALHAVGYPARASSQRSCCHR
jgi:putative spermidine/putrescine transport system permease protein